MRSDWCGEWSAAFTAEPDNSAEPETFAEPVASADDWSVFRGPGWAAKRPGYNRVELEPGQALARWGAGCSAIFTRDSQWREIQGARARGLPDEALCALLGIARAESRP